VINFFQAIIIGLLQGFTELFPISSLGHAILIPSLLGWEEVYSNEAVGTSFYVSFAVLVHLATTIAIIFFYRKEWAKIIKGFFGSIKNRSITNPHEKLAWLLLFATIPAGLIGVVFNVVLEEQFTEPLSAAIFLTINGFILLFGAYLHKRNQTKRQDYSLESTARNTDKISLKRSGIIGVSQVGALFAGISRSGVTMVGGLVSGLDSEDAARFSFLLSTPIILGAAIYKLPDFFHAGMAESRPEMLVGGVVAGFAAYFSVKFLDRYFRTRSLLPFAIYCLVFGAFMIFFETTKATL
jgi:undecaprenyl-diphosphatase